MPFVKRAGLKDSFCTEWAFLRVITARYLQALGEGICRICLSLNLNTGVNIAKFVSKNCKYAKKSHERTENVLNFLHAKDSFLALRRVLAVSKIVSKVVFGDQSCLL